MIPYSKEVLNSKGAPKDDDAGSNSGAACIFVRDGVTWKQQAKLVPKDSAPSDALGEAFIVLEDTVVVWAPGTVLVESDSRAPPTSLLGRQ